MIEYTRTLNLMCIVRVFQCIILLLNTVLIFILNEIVFDTPLQVYGPSVQMPAVVLLALHV